MIAQAWNEPLLKSGKNFRRRLIAVLAALGSRVEACPDDLVNEIHLRCPPFVGFGRLQGEHVGFSLDEDGLRKALDSEIVASSDEERDARDSKTQYLLIESRQHRRLVDLDKGTVLWTVRHENNGNVFTTLRAKD